MQVANHTMRRVEMNEAIQKAQKAMQRALKNYGSTSPQFKAAQRKWVAMKEG